MYPVTWPRLWNLGGRRRIPRGRGETVSRGAGSVGNNPPRADPCRAMVGDAGGERRREPYVAETDRAGGWGRSRRGPSGDGLSRSCFEDGLVGKEKSRRTLERLPTTAALRHSSQLTVNSVRLPFGKKC